MQCFTMESGEVHDRVTGAVQNATHAALLTFGSPPSTAQHDPQLALSQVCILVEVKHLRRIKMTEQR